jgi:hypothetical protein
MMDFEVGTDYTTNLLSTPQQWFLIGSNHMFGAGGGQVYLDNVGTIIDASAWTLAPAGGGASVPEIDAASGTGALTLLLGALGLAAERRRKAA